LCLVVWREFVYPRLHSMINRRSAPCLIGLLLAVAASAPAAKRNIVLGLDKKEIRDMTSAGLVLAFTIEVANTSSTTYSLSEYDYRVVVQDADFFAWRTALDEPIPVAGEGKTRIALPVKISYADLFKAIPGLEGKPKLGCYVTGLMIFTDARKHQEKVPFAFSGDFPVFKDIGFVIQPITVKTLTIGGTEFDFAFACRNPNDFEIVLGDLGYRLELDGKTAAEGTIRGESKLGPGGEKSFSVPVMLDFFEVGKEYYAIFDKASAAGRLVLKTEADSSWGPFKLELTKDETVKLAK
jgi:LEA14-like dessication related protein